MPNNKLQLINNKLVLAGNKLALGCGSGCPNVACGVYMAKTVGYSSGNVARTVYAHRIAFNCLTPISGYYYPSYTGSALSPIQESVQCEQTYATSNLCSGGEHEEPPGTTLSSAYSFYPRKSVATGLWEFYTTSLRAPYGTIALPPGTSDYLFLPRWNGEAYCSGLGSVCIPDMHWLVSCYMVEFGTCPADNAAWQTALAPYATVDCTWPAYANDSHILYGAECDSYGSSPLMADVTSNQLAVEAVPEAAALGTLVQTRKPICQACEQYAGDASVFTVKCLRIGGEGCRCANLITGKCPDGKWG